MIRTKTLVKYALPILLASVALVAQAGPPGGPPPPPSTSSVPVDAGIIGLLAAGLSYGIYKLRSNKKAIQE